MPERLLDSVDIALLTETFLLAPEDIPGMRGFHQLATMPEGGRGRPVGGVSIYLRAGMPRLQCVFKDQYCLLLASKSLNFGVFYLPPNLDGVEVIDIVSAGIAHLDLRIPTVIGGDFNCRIDDGRHDEKGEVLLSFLLERGLQLVNCKRNYTYVCGNGRSTIDLLFHNIEPSLEIDHRVLDVTFRKHLPVTVDLHFTAMGGNQMARARHHSTKRLDL